MPDYSGYEYAARWKADQWEIEVYEKKPGTQVIFQGALRASNATEEGTALAHNVAKQVIDALTQHGEPFILGQSALDGSDRI